MAQGNDVVLTAVANPVTPTAGGNLSYQWDFTGDGLFNDATGSNPVFSAVNLAGPQTIPVRLRINGGDPVATTVTVINLPPTAHAGGPYTVPFGGSVVLAGSATDPGGTGDSFTYLWDLNGTPASGPNPTFNATGIAAGSSVLVHLHVTDQGGLSSDDTATITVVNVADLAVDSPDISFAPVNPAVGSPVVIFANVTNQGLADAQNVKVSFYATGNWLGDATIPDLQPGSSALASLPSPTSFATASLQLIRVEVNPDGTIPEANTANNAASQVLQVGQPSLSGASIVIQAPAITGNQGQVTDVGGSAVYAFTSTTRTFPVQGAVVTVSVIDSSNNILGIYTGSNTDVNGDLNQAILAPATIGTYTLLEKVTDGTVTQTTTATLIVVQSPTPPTPPPSGPPYTGGSPASDAFVSSQGIVFSNENPGIGEPITILAYVGLLGPQAAAAVPVTLNDIVPVGGALQTFRIGQTTVDLSASSSAPVYATATFPWTGTAAGAQIIQAVIQPGFPQPTSDDQATRLIYVGNTPQSLQLQDSVVRLVDADGNSKTSPGDILQYTITYVNTASTALTNGVLLETFDTNLLQTPFALSPSGTVEGNTITWDLGTIPAGGSGTVTYQVAIQPWSQFPRSSTPVPVVTRHFSLRTRHRQPAPQRASTSIPPTTGRSRPSPRRPTRPSTARRSPSRPRSRPMPPGAAHPTGGVTFEDGTTVLGTGTLSASGVASYTTTAFQLSVGAGHSITAVYGGDTNFQGSSSAAMGQAVDQDGTTTLVSSSANPSVYGQPVTFTATVSASAPGSGVPTGGVTFEDGATVLGTGTLSASGVASYTTTAFQLSVGRRPLDHGGLRRGFQRSGKHLGGSESGGHPGFDNDCADVVGESVGVRSVGDIHGDGGRGESWCRRAHGDGDVRGWRDQPGYGRAQRQRSGDVQHIDAERGRPLDHGGLRRGFQRSGKHLGGAGPGGQQGRHSDHRQRFTDCRGFRANGHLRGHGDGQCSRFRHAHGHRRLLRHLDEHRPDARRRAAFVEHGHVHDDQPGSRSSYHQSHLLRRHQLPGQPRQHRHGHGRPVDHPA